MHPSLLHTDHRPWPLPEHGWAWRQSWRDLAFIHFRVNSAGLRGLLPPGMRLQEFDKTAWVGLVPFRMSCVAHRLLPVLPGFDSFPELNLRTYVEMDGKPGVWFFSLDAGFLPIVLGGRHVYHLPYFSASMSQQRQDDWWRFSSVRHSGDARFAARYRPLGEVFHAIPGTFEHWATERYCLYAATPEGAIDRVEVHHAPWPIQHAELVMPECTILSSAGIIADASPPLCHFSTGVDVVSYPKDHLFPNRLA